MNSKMWGNEYRTTVVCIDAYDHKSFQGRLYNPYLTDGWLFRSLMEYLRQMDALLDQMHFPQPFAESRGADLTPVAAVKRPVDEDVQEGRVSTFAVRVLFRQNTTWQGSVFWLEGEREEQFRSALELVQIMDNILTEQNALKNHQSCGA